MKSIWKNLFWISLGLLIVTNVFWIYQVLDNAVGNDYYKVSCNEYHGDMLGLKKVLDSKKTKIETLDFLNEHAIEYDSFQKGNEFIISLNSFDLTFNAQGNLVASHIH